MSSKNSTFIIQRAIHIKQIDAMLSLNNLYHL